MKKQATAAVMAATLVSAVDVGSAADISLNGFAKELRVHTELTSVTRLERPLDFAVTIGDFPIELEKTTLAQVAGHFGGTVHQQGDAGNFITWLFQRD